MAMLLLQTVQIKVTDTATLDPMETCFPRKAGHMTIRDPVREVTIAESHLPMKKTLQLGVRQMTWPLSISGTNRRSQLLTGERIQSLVYYLSNGHVAAAGRCLARFNALDITSNISFDPRKFCIASALTQEPRLSRAVTWIFTALLSSFCS